jgi:hypothetical protein
MFICTNDDAACGIGCNLKEAYDRYVYAYGEIDIDDLNFYEIGAPIPVEIQVVPKTVVTSITQKKGK